MFALVGLLTLTIVFAYKHLCFNKERDVFMLIQINRSAAMHAGSHDCVLCYVDT